MGLDYRTALITGASSGIGRALAGWFAARGVKVYAAARRTQDLEALQREVGENVVPLTLDVSKAEATFTRIATLDEECGGLDLVVANAGVGGETRPKRLDWPRLQNLIDVNVAGATATLLAALPGMIERKKGHLVGVSSLAALQALPRFAAYCASKAWVTMFCESLRFDVERHGVAVTAIHPGFVKSELTAKNDFTMPFILETADGADRMGRAIARKAKHYSFPWPLAAAAALGSALPRPLYRLIGKRL